MILQLPVVRTRFLPAPSGLGWPTGIRCPRCQRREIVYNGNYFCSGMGPLDSRDEPECEWALPEQSPDSQAWLHHQDLERALIASQRRRQREERQLTVSIERRS